MKKSMLDVAYEILEKAEAPLAFNDMLNEVSKRLEMTEEETRSKMAQFYTNLSVDGRFVCCTDNHWEVREKVPFEQVHIDMNDAYNDKEDLEEDNLDDVEKELGEDDENGIVEPNDFDSDDDAEIEEVTDDGEAE